MHGRRESRIWDTLHSTADAAGATPDGGLRRLSCDDADKTARDHFAEEARALGLKYEVDAMGCQWATLPGERDDVAPIGVGSHLDSVQSGGRFDGPLGVFTGLEVVKVLRESGWTTFAPVAVVNWTNEEGARFPPGCMSSAVWAHKLDIAYAHACTDTADRTTTIGDELRRIGYMGTREVSYKTNPLSAHFEIVKHIEQGSRLEKAGLDVGVVDGAQGMRWYDVSLRGVTRHTDTTPMDIRKDALVGAAKIVLEVERIGHASNGGMATVSLFKSSPQNFCNIPSSVDFSFSMQHPEPAVLQGMTGQIEDFVHKVAATHGLEVADYSNVWSYDPSDFDAEAVACVESAAKEMGYSYQRLISHTGHDSIYTNMVVPTAMVFTPCRDGISHSPLEYASPENCSIGAQTVLGAVLKYDDILRKKYST
ncbi:putative N-carbamoyl-L-amino acid hydrolase [Neofusicoccum parvum]|uniref:N-carbamoyl-L-amino acid hydrolase n=1 Tax=Neofusicoccum parvum TaxID=310453 RepID=A0ACB5S806_9PEZI|nr:putative N-carbamoyl-L-amino acid hydrolase [Neofusicoccum parvum]